MDEYDVNELRYQITLVNYYPDTDFNHGYTQFANVRFDVQEEEEIFYHTNVLSFNDSVGANMPNPSLGFGDNSTGSDVFNVLQKFLKNKQVTLCGALVYILAKRYPIENALDDLVAQLRKNHVFVYVVAHDVPSGGNNPEALCDVAVRTNGFCVFDSGFHFWATVGDMAVVSCIPNQFVSQSFTVNGSGRLEMPVFQTPNPYDSYDEAVFVVITVENHKLTNFVSLNYTIASLDGSFVWIGPSPSGPMKGTALLDQPDLDGLVNYKWTIDYYFSNDEPQIIETRLYSHYYHDFLPLPDN